MGFIDELKEALLTICIWIVSVLFAFCAPAFWIFGYKVNVTISKRNFIKHE